MGETHGLFQAQVLEAQKRLRRERSAAKWCNILVISQLESSSGLAAKIWAAKTSKRVGNHWLKLQLTLKINRKIPIEWGLNHRNKRHENFAKMVMHRDFSSDWWILLQHFVIYSNIFVFFCEIVLTESRPNPHKWMQIMIRSWEVIQFR